MGAMRICGFVLIGVSLFLVTFFLILPNLACCSYTFSQTSEPLWFLVGMVIPGMAIGILLVIAKQKEGYPEPP